MNAPSARQLQLLEQLRELLATRFSLTEVKGQEHWRHFEDEELGFPSLGSSAGFRMRDLPFPVHVSTPFPWESQPTERIKAVFPDWDDGRGGGAPWALFRDARTRRSYRKLGFEDRVGYYRATWRDTAKPNSIVQTIERLVVVPVRILRPEDLPADADWPWHGLVQLMAASRRTKLRSDGKRFRAVIRSGTTRSTVNVSEADAAFLRLWWRGGGT